MLSTPEICFTNGELLAVLEAIEHNLDQNRVLHKMKDERWLRSAREKLLANLSKRF